MKATFELVGSEAKQVIKIIPETDFEKEYVKRMGFRHHIQDCPIIYMGEVKNE